MGLYDNAWPHVYEEIRRFYPVWYDTSAPYIEQVEARIPSALDVFKRK